MDRRERCRVRFVGGCWHNKVPVVELCNEILVHIPVDSMAVRILEWDELIKLPRYETQAYRLTRMRLGSGGEFLEYHLDGNSDEYGSPRYGDMSRTPGWAYDPDFDVTLECCYGPT